MGYWYWLTEDGARCAPTLEWQRGDVARALAATQPATLDMIRDRAERDGVRTDGELSALVSFHLWQLRDTRTFIPPIVDRERMGRREGHRDARYRAASAPTLAEAAALAAVSPMTATQIAAALRALGRKDASEPAVAEAIAQAGPSIARINAADGRILFISRKGAK